MTYGPIDFLAVAFEGNRFRGEILASLLDLVERRIIRIIDMVAVIKDVDGNVIARELRELDPETVVVLDPLQISVTGLVASDDITMIGEMLEPNTAAGLLLFENLWAIQAKEAFLRAGATVLMQERIPHEVVVEALSDIAQTAAANG